MSQILRSLVLGGLYDRKQLAELWGYQSYQAIAKGVFTPAGSGVIILFVTFEKQRALTQYSDFIDQCWLHWEGEAKHRSDLRVALAQNSGETVVLFFRDRHHSDFRYLGPLHLEFFEAHPDRPSEFVFKVPYLEKSLMAEEARSHSSGDYLVARDGPVASTTRPSLILARQGQGLFRVRVLHRWRGQCAVTRCGFAPALRASHIKPWCASTDVERLSPANGLLLVPNLDTLFDQGCVTFESDGAIRISSRVDSEDRGLLLPWRDCRLAMIPKDSEQYLEYHRDCVFESTPSP